MLKDFEKCKKTIQSCKTIPQITVAIHMANNFARKWNKGKKTFDKFTECFNELLLAQKKRLHVLNDYGKTLEGSECLCVSNEDHPVWKGRVEYFEDWNKPHQLPLPMITNLEDGKLYLVMGVVLPYNEGTQIMLNEMPYKERWNFVCKPHAKMEDE